MGTVTLYLKAFLALWPYIQTLLDLWVKTPEEKRDQLVSDLHKGFQKAAETQGDTSDIENTIAGGR